MNFSFILVVLVGLSLACAKKADSQSGKNPDSDGWVVYEDDMFRVAYPPNSEVVGTTGNKQDPAAPSLAIIPPPAAGKSVIGAFVLQLDKDSKGMLLRDGIEAELKRSKANRGVVIGPPKEVSVVNGRCLGALVISPTSNCEKGHGSCFAPIFSTLCDGPSGKRFTASTVLSSGPSRDSLSPQAQREAVTYERILRSLEFKKS